jgi:hypothetical protein
MEGVVPVLDKKIKVNTSAVKAKSKGALIVKIE